MATFQEEFDPTEQGLSRANAYWLGRAAALAYEGHAKITKELASWGMTEHLFVDAGDTEGFLATDGRCVLLAFRGTEATRINDWFTDLKIGQVRGPVGEVHRGFRDALELAWPAVDGWLAKHAARVPLFITGHSLGGALAVLATAKRRLRGGNAAPLPVQGLYTFGQPRVGDGRFVGALESDFKFRWFRYVNNNDVVPRVPKRLMGYADGGIVRYFDEEGDEHDELGFWSKLADALSGRLKDLLRPGTDGIKDHSMARYLENLEKAKVREQRRAKKR